MSPVVDRLTESGHDGEDATSLFGAIDALRIPIQYLAELFTAGDPAPARDVLARLAAMRSFMRDVNLGREPDPTIADSVGMTPEDLEDMHRLLAIAKYEERYVIPTAQAEAGDPAELAHKLEQTATECSLDYDGGPGMGGSGPFGENSGGSTPLAVENFHMLKQRQTADRPVDPGDRSRRVNLLNWDGEGDGRHLLPPRAAEHRGSPDIAPGGGDDTAGHVEPRP